MLPYSLPCSYFSSSFSGKKIHHWKKVSKSSKKNFLPPHPVSSILGMNLFGCKFCTENLKDNSRECDRKNFDSLLWALVTVFQVRKRERKKIAFVWQPIVCVLSALYILKRKEGKFFIKSGIFKLLTFLDKAVAVDTFCHFLAHSLAQLTHTDTRLIKYSSLLCESQKGDQFNL